MTPQSAEIRKKQLIHLLIQNGIYKKSKRHLYELSLTELESEYNHVRRAPEHAEAYSENLPTADSGKQRGDYGQSKADERYL